MIRTPHRSVTRFFIPMIDVLTVLFCMFLLMPIFRESASFGRDGDVTDDLKKDVAEQQSRLDELEKDQLRVRTALAELAEKKRGLLQQSIFIRLLYVSPKDGSLHYFDPADLKRGSVAINSAAAADALIAQHKKEAGDRDVFYIFQEPRDDQGKVAPYPTYAQEKRYARWFSEVNFDGCVKPALSKGGP